MFPSIPLCVDELNYQVLLLVQLATQMNLLHPTKNVKGHSSRSGRDQHMEVDTVVCALASLELAYIKTICRFVNIYTKTISSQPLTIFGKSNILSKKNTQFMCLAFILCSLCPCSTATAKYCHCN